VRRRRTREDRCGHQPPAPHLSSDWIIDFAGAAACRRE
jgi:hypothetical protein